MVTYRFVSPVDLYSFVSLSLPRDGFLIQFLTEQSSVHHPRHHVLMDSSNGCPVS